MFIMGEIMKTIMLCLLLVIISISDAFAISLAAISSDTSKTIYIITHDDGVAAFRTVGKLFNSAGYDLEDSEEALMIVSTEVMNKDYGLFNLSKLAIKLKAEINMLDSLTIIKLSGQFLDKRNDGTEAFETYFNKYSDVITSSNISGSAGKSAWDYMMEIAHRYKNGIIKIQK